MNTSSDPQSILRNTEETEYSKSAIHVNTVMVPLSHVKFAEKWINRISCGSYQVIEVVFTITSYQLTPLVLHPHCWRFLDSVENFIIYKRNFRYEIQRIRPYDNQPTTQYSKTIHTLPIQSSDDTGIYE